MEFGTPVVSLLCRRKRRKFYDDCTNARLIDIPNDQYLKLKKKHPLARRHSIGSIIINNYGTLITISVFFFLRFLSSLFRILQSVRFGQVFHNHITIHSIFQTDFERFMYSKSSFIAIIVNFSISSAHKIFNKTTYSTKSVTPIICPAMYRNNSFRTRSKRVS